MRPDDNRHLSDLREEIISLGPWHMDVEVMPEISTRVFLEAPEDMYPASFGTVSFIDPRQGWDPRQGFADLLKQIYPEGLAGRSMLDCACNCGAYLFWAKELGAGECLGFDVRKHWIDQARFLTANRVWPTDRMRFEICDLYDLPKLGLEPFDVTLFNGIFYHLPDPIAGLKIAADLTKELIVVNTATRNGLPDGMLAIDEEGREELMSGVYGLNWLPTGPSVLARILRWMGFTKIHCTFWKTEVPHQPSTIGRLEMLASRKTDLLPQHIQDLRWEWVDRHQGDEVLDPRSCSLRSDERRSR